MPDQYLINHIKFERERGVSDEKIRQWFISVGLKEADFVNEFKFLDASINKFPQNNQKVIKEALRHHEPPKKITAWDKFFVRAKIILALSIIAACLLFALGFKKELVNIPNRLFVFVNRIVDNFTKKDEFASIGETATSTTDVQTTQTLEISTGTTITVATSAAATTSAATTVAPIIEPSATDATFISAINQARILWQKKKGNESLSMAQKALQLAQTNQEKARAQYWIGLSYNLLGNKDAAEQAELSALNLAPGYEPSYVTLSAIKLDQKDCNQAFEYANKALSLNANDPWALNNSGLSYLCLGDVNNAIIRLQKAVSLAPGSYVIRHNLDTALQQINY